tara:strand:- start:970 stop:1260 length:291 start_codon:yes stop_codon:yes gene_type:complete
MTKTEVKKIKTLKVIELLENKYNAVHFDNDAGSYFTFSIGKFEGSLMRNDFYVSFWESIKLGAGFTDEEYETHFEAVRLEDEINGEIQLMLKNLKF